MPEPLLLPVERPLPTTEAFANVRLPLARARTVGVDGRVCSAEWQRAQMQKQNRCPRPPQSLANLSCLIGARARTVCKGRTASRSRDSESSAAAPAAHLEMLEIP